MNEEAIKLFNLADVYGVKIVSFEMNGKEIEIRTLKTGNIQDFIAAIIIKYELHELKSDYHIGEFVKFFCLTLKTERSDKK